jgi:hypothetical protein
MNELELLREAGLTLYQSKVYLALKQEPDLTPTEAACKSGIPKSKIHETLYSLENLGLIVRYLNKKGAAEIDRRICEFLTEMKGHNVTVKVFGRGRLKQVWGPNGVSLTSVVDRRIKQLQRTKQRITRYEMCEKT